MLNPGRYNITVWQGATYRTTMTLYADNGSTLWDLTGYSSQLVVKNVSSVDLLTLDTTNGGIILGGTNGTIQIYISATATTGFTWNQGNYGLTITAPSGGDTTPILRGGFTVRIL